MVYRKHISGPLLDRSNIHVEMPRVACQKLGDDRLGAARKALDKKSSARGLQHDSYLNICFILTNRDLLNVTHMAGTEHWHR